MLHMLSDQEIPVEARRTCVGVACIAYMSGAWVILCGAPQRRDTASGVSWHSPDSPTQERAQLKGPVLDLCRWEKDQARQEFCALVAEVPILDVWRGR